MGNRISVKTVQRPNLLAVLFFAGLMGLFYHQVIFGNAIFVFVDASRFFYPLWKWGAGVLNLGFIPLWNPDAQFGAPYLADPQMAYAYPLVPLVYYLVDPIDAFATLVVFHHLWALLGFWFFARGQGFSARASLLGSFVFGFSLHVVGSAWTPVALMAISWIPWVFFALERVLQDRKGGWLYLSFAWAMQLAAGYPVLIYLTTLALGMYLALRITTIPPTPPLSKGGKRKFFPWRLIGTVVLSGLVALAYNLVWGLPFLEMFRFSNYAGGAGRFDDLGLNELGTGFNPFVLGHPATNQYQGLAPYWVSSYFVGLPTLCLLAWGAYRRIFNKPSVFLFGVPLVLSLGALGTGRILRAILPGYSLAVHSGYWISLLVFGAAWMVVQTLESFLDAQPLGKRNEKATWMIIILAVYCISAALGSPLHSIFFWLSLVCLALTAFFKEVQVCWWFLLASTVLSLGAAASSLNLLLDRSYYSQPPEALASLEKEGRLFFSPIDMKEAIRLQGADMPAAYERAKQQLYPNWPLAFGKEETPFYNTFQLRNSFDWTYQPFRYSLKLSRKVLDYLNVRYLFGKNQFRDFKPITAEKEEKGKLSENPTPLPKWFAVEKSIAAGPSFEGDLEKSNRESMDWGKACYIGDASKAGTYQRRQVAVQTYWPNRLALTADGKGRALVVSSETGFPGWKAYVEGKEKSVEQINHAFRGVVLEEGERRVILQFQSRTFQLGLFCALLVCGIWSGAFLKGWKE